MEKKASRKKSPKQSDAKQYDKKKTTTDDVKKSEERKTVSVFVCCSQIRFDKLSHRQAETAAMTAQMLAHICADSHDVWLDKKRKEAMRVLIQTAPQVLKVPMRTMMSHEVALKSHVKGLACIYVDVPGARVSTGSTVYRVKLWDFAAVSYSSSGNRLLAVTGSSQPKVLTREGVEEMQFSKGDMYVLDMANTNGHTYTATGGQWHPKAREQMITSSLDGTVRLWKTMLIPFRNIDL
ncbi:hypothetical protein PsorP6_011413 [Peronosclerospora sorghi]|uniref:Uncharacterized protein n=1 Tax=Peronosclerospora sorghi TaxID=230839 RepID=A0ACC0WHQ1_9STRA|nr:hypothetical protein PsorP6_011413 [Peronosclerospora sorghi]